jgi:hypothetical protein
VALALLSVVQFMLVLDIAIVNVALPSIKVDLGFSGEPAVGIARTRSCSGLPASAGERPTSQAAGACS